MSIFHGVAGKRIGEPKGICFHNDAGSASADSDFYAGWLPNHNPADGFAHMYVAEDGTLLAEDLDYRAYHCGNSYGNENYLSIEICQSMGDEQIFRSNEQKAFDLAARIFLFYGWEPNSETVKLHRDFATTECPHRTQELHGEGEVSRNYIIAELKRRLECPVDIREVTKMMCFYRVEGSNKVYWFNGREVRYLTHPDQITILSRIYKDCYGVEPPSYEFKKSAPYHMRLIQACNGEVQK